MSDTKIKIDIGQGIIEAEGDEQFVKSIYNDFKDRLNAPAARSGSGSGKRRGSKPKVANNDGSEKPKKAKTKNSDTPSLVKDLDLTGGKDYPSLRDFYGEYAPKSNMEKNLIFAYYLQHKASHSNIGVDEIYTCYRNIVKLKVPKALTQSLIDTSARKGWIDTKSLSDLKVPIAGMNHIEHDMAKTDDNG